VIWENVEAKDDWMAGIVKNKRSRVEADKEMPPLDYPKCLIVLLPGDEGYDKMMETMNDKNSVCPGE